MAGERRRADRRKEAERTQTVFKVPKESRSGRSCPSGHSEFNLCSAGSWAVNPGLISEPSPRTEGKGEQSRPQEEDLQTIAGSDGGEAAE